MKNIIIILILLAIGTMTWSAVEKNEKEKSDELFNKAIYHTIGSSDEVMSSEEIITLLEKASELGNGLASYELAFHYKEKKDLDKAIALCEKSFEQGHIYAAVELGNLFLHNEKVIDKKKAVEWYRKALDNGILFDQEQNQNQNQAVDKIIMGNLDKNVDYQEVQAKADKGDPACQYLLIYNECGSFAFRILDEEGINRVVTQLTEAYEKKYSPAAFLLAELYFYGTDINMLTDKELKEYKTKAEEWFTKAAKLGHVEASYTLGWNYLMTRPHFSTNPKEGIKWLEIAANQGNRDAQYDLGVCYSTADGINANEKEAVKWYYLSALQGNKDAAKALSDCYKNGTGVKKDTKKMYNWYRNSLPDTTEFNRHIF